MKKTELLVCRVLLGGGAAGGFWLGEKEGNLGWERGNLGWERENLGRKMENLGRKREIGEFSPRGLMGVVVQTRYGLRAVLDYNSQQSSRCVTWCRRANRSARVAEVEPPPFTALPAALTGPKHRDGLGGSGDVTGPRRMLGNPGRRR